MAIREKERYGYSLPAFPNRNRSALGVFVFVILVNCAYSAQFSVSSMDPEAARTARESLDLAFHMSNILDTGLRKGKPSLLSSSLASASSSLP
ncbi:hypothetical protein D0Y65_006982 [Glycine soja]|nr:hypothetical protein D0Y65_006982 [Glycine soja]